MDWEIKVIVFLTLLIFSPLRERAIAIHPNLLLQRHEIFFEGGWLLTVGRDTLIMEICPLFLQMLTLHYTQPS